MEVRFYALYNMHFCGVFTEGSSVCNDYSVLLHMVCLPRVSC